MNEWVLYSIIAIIIWGFWSFFNKMAADRIDPRIAVVFYAIGVFAVGLIMAGYFKFKLKYNTGSIYGLLAGICACAGGIFFLMALNKGKASLVVPFTALYPVITVILSFIILKERVSIINLIGIVIAIVAGILIAV